ncbi:O-acetyl-ADP-ribose deacetylase [Nocardiopsis mangrovi]|uniref:O-acetyl-ADP-ribose deacetylase n=1 Tax=Nocardiopsis mangrovi TaxID=1179818 RepID=A0ABV9DXR9_9ACTN
MEIRLIKGDITDQRVDVIVNAANSSLLGGSGVDGAVHRKGGPEILAACRRLRASTYGKGLPTGGAVATTAGDLPSHWVIHTVGPVHSATEDRTDLLAECYRKSLAIADELGAQSIAFPAISAGAYGWPMQHAADVAVRTAFASSTTVGEIRFVLFSTEAFAAFDRAVTRNRPQAPS